MKKILLYAFLVFNAHAYSQCIKGNCSTGIGTYDYSWCVYTGEFKNGKPEGKGVMKYDEYTYSGRFVNGLEDGLGVITSKAGIEKNVEYAKGIKQQYNLEKIEAGNYKPLVVQDANCISGDCINGFGTYIYPSGNKYVGNRSNYKMDGSGTFYFLDGERFEGTFKNNLFSNGSYFFKIGAIYKGTYDNKGLQLNGTITSVTGVSIPYVNGKPIIPPAPQIAKEEKQGNEGKKGGTLTFCRMCCGSGKEISRVVTGTTYETTHYRACSKCGGAGVWLQ